MRSRLAFLLGPTASGKTDLSFEIARQCEVGLVNADSVLIYEGLNIGAARPDSGQLNRFKNFLFSEVSLDQEFTAGPYRDRARELINLYPQLLFVGGSGFYLRAFETGMTAVPSVDPHVVANLKDEWSTKGLESLYSELKRVDPQSAAKINPHDQYRILRALGIFRSTGRTRSDWEQDQNRQYPTLGPILKVGLRIDREKLRLNVQKRTRIMLESGLIEEVRSLLSQGYGNRPGLRTIGYKETAMYLRNECTYENLESSIVTNTMQLAKRQMTWLKSQKDILWFDPLVDRKEICDKFKDWYESEVKYEEHDRIWNLHQENQIGGNRSFR